MKGKFWVFHVEVFFSYNLIQQNDFKCLIIYFVDISCIIQFVSVIDIFNIYCDPEVFASEIMTRLPIK